LGKSGFTAILTGILTKNGRFTTNATAPTFPGWVPWFAFAPSIHRNGACNNLPSKLRVVWRTFGPTFIRLVYGLNFSPNFSSSNDDSASQDLVNASRGKPIIVSESGWPTCGETRGEAVASLENAKFYLAEFLSWAQANEVRYFYFEAFDEPWKIAAEGPQGACWGLWDQQGNLKPGINVVLRGPDAKIADSDRQSAATIMPD
jgi:hypothetical protein